jgi:sporulation protein YlmC with PRC-barrel domain
LSVPYLSDLRQRAVLDAGGSGIGRLKDLAIVPREAYPSVRWAIVASGSGERVLRWSDIAIEPAHVRLRARLASLAPEALPTDAMRLGRDLLDRRIVDAEGGRVHQVSDLQLEEMGRELRLVGADVGWGGLLRRIGIEGLVGGVAGALRRPLRSRVVPWARVDLEAES